MPSALAARKNIVQKRPHILAAVAAAEAAQVAGAKSKGKTKAETDGQSRWQTERAGGRGSEDDYAVRTTIQVGKGRIEE